MQKGVFITLIVLSLISSATAFSFNGTVKNSTWGLASGANVTLFNITFNGNDEPVSQYFNSTITNENGSFNFTNISENMNENWNVLITTNHTDGNFTEVTRITDFLPWEALRYDLSGSTFYLDPALTLNISVTNITNTTPGQFEFGYALMVDGAINVMVNSRFNSTNNSNILLPVSKLRNYTLYTFRFDAPKVPPLSTFFDTSSFTKGTITNITVNMTSSRCEIKGFINTSAGVNNTNLTIQSITAQITPQRTGGYFVPEQMLVSPTNSPVFINNGSHNSNNSFSVGNYTLEGIPCSSVGDGVGVMITVNAMYNGTELANESVYWQGIVGLNLTTNLTAANGTNITLHPLGGAYENSSFNTSKHTIRLYNAENSSENLSFAHVEMSYITPEGLDLLVSVDQLTNGAFQYSFMNGSNVTLTIFAGEYSPLEYTLNLTQASTSIPIRQFVMQAFDGGSAEDFSGAQENAMTVTIFKNDPACSTFEFNRTDCLLENFTGDINTNALQISRPVNAMIKAGDGAELYFIGVDLLGASLPDAKMSTDFLSDPNKVFNFGSFAPKIYDEVLIKMPYNASEVNESNPINFTIPVLYDENDIIIWNGSTNNLSELPADYSDFNTTVLNLSNDITCTNSSSDPNCYQNLNKNEIWVRIPHFSSVGIELVLTTNNPTTPAPAEDNSSSDNSGDSSTDTTTTPVTIPTLTSSDFSTIIAGISYHKQFKTKGETHNITIDKINNESVNLTFYSYPQSLELGDDENATVDLDEDAIYDILVHVSDLRLTTAIVKLKEISIPYTPPPSPIVVNEDDDNDIIVVDNTPPPTTEKNTTSNETGKQEANSFSSGGWIWLVILGIMLIGGASYWYFFIRVQNPGDEVSGKRDHMFRLDGPNKKEEPKRLMKADTRLKSVHEKLVKKEPKKEGGNPFAKLKFLKRKPAEVKEPKMSDHVKKLEQDVKEAGRKFSMKKAEKKKAKT